MHPIGRPDINAVTRELYWMRKGSALPPGVAGMPAARLAPRPATSLWLAPGWGGGEGLSVSNCEELEKQR